MYSLSAKDIFVIQGQKIEVQDYFFEKLEKKLKNENLISKEYKDPSILKGLLKLQKIYSGEKLNKNTEITILKTKKYRQIKVLEIEDFIAYYVSKYKTYAIKYKDETIDFVSIQEIKRLSENRITYEYPIKEKFRLSSNFGNRKHPITKKHRFHNGIDLVAPIGTPIYSIDEGIVKVYKKNHSKNGNYIAIKHPNGIKSYYLHLNSLNPNLKHSSKVIKGEIIGFLGNTGRSTGAHLHFSLKKDNKWLNPRHYIRNQNEKIIKMKKLTYNRLLKKNIIKQIKRMKKEKII